MIGAGIAALVAGLFFVRARFAAASGAAGFWCSGPPLKPSHWRSLLQNIFWQHTISWASCHAGCRDLCFLDLFRRCGSAGGALSFITWRYVRWSASLLALLFLIIVATIDLPSLPQQIHERLFWTLTVREMSFAGGAMVLAGSLWPRGRSAGTALLVAGRLLVACVFIFYAIEHFLFPRFVPGVPLEKVTPAWMPAPTLIAYFVGITLLVAGVGLMVRRTRSIAAASAGTVLLLLTIFFYIPILLTEIHSPLGVEGVNYVGDTLLFAATALLAAFGADSPRVSEPKQL
jgi:uncharacterized membrane protein